MVEKLMQYVWQHRLWDSAGLVTNDGRKISVIDTGLLNTDSGPDFFNAKINIGGEMWAGNVEIHLRASDWRRHHHDTDKAYDSVVLHVVAKDDCPVYRSNGERIAQCVMQVSPHFSERYHQLVDADNELPCASAIAQVPSIHITEWIEALTFERMHAKVDHINELLGSFAGSWEDVCYVMLARNLGFGINGDAFERLARRTPLRLIGKHSDSLFQIEALMFGQAGMLNADTNPQDEYYQQLCKEYAFLANKFSLTPMGGSTWRFFRIRPQSFPYRRIAMLAQLLHGGFRFFTDIIEAPDEAALRRLFDIELSGYWASHYAFGKPSTGNARALSNQSVDILLINTVAPLYYAYGELIGSYETTDRAIDLLSHLRPEHNSIVEMFARSGIRADNAMMSQALIQLRRQYCEARKCIYCRIGHQLLAKAASQP
ncbi:MAG: DUF2851 family protein [Muribaculaceae bacterium]|nr:DUF2851 family protein [Muribaculaceae bacterium]